MRREEYLFEERGKFRPPGGIGVRNLYGVINLYHKVRGGGEFRMGSEKGVRNFNHQGVRGGC